MNFQQTHVESEHKHGSPLISCRFAAAADTVFFGAEDFSVWRWNRTSDQKVQYPTEAWVRALALADDDKTLLTAGYDGRLIWWSADAEEPQPLREVAAHEGWARSMALSPDGTTVATVGNDKVCRLWKLADGALITELRGDEAVKEAIAHRSITYNVAFHPDGKSLVTGDLMGQLIHWDLDTGRPVRNWTAESLSKYDTTFRAQVGGFRSLRFNGDGSKLFAAGITNVTNAFAGVGNPSIVEFDWKDGKQLIEYLSKPALQGVAWNFALHPDGTIIGVHGGSGGSLMFWKPGVAEAAHQFKLPQNGRDLDMHADGLHLAVACSDGQLRICLMDAKSA